MSLDQIRAELTSEEVLLINRIEDDNGLKLVVQKDRMEIPGVALTPDYVQGYSARLLCAMVAVPFKGYVLAKVAKPKFFFCC